MAYTRQLHPWQVSVKEAIEIQERLRKRIIIKGNPYVWKVAGVDVGYSDGKLIAAVCIFRCSTPGVEHLNFLLDIGFQNRCGVHIGMLNKICACLPAGR